MGRTAHRALPQGHTPSVQAAQGRQAPPRCQTVPGGLFLCVHRSVFVPMCPRVCMVSLSSVVAVHLQTQNDGKSTEIPHQMRRLQSVPCAATENRPRANQDLLASGPTGPALTLC